MAIVKGSRQYRLKVVEDRPLGRIAGYLLIVLVFGCGVYGSLKYGYMLGMAEQEKALNDVAQLSSELELQKEKSEELAQLLTNAKTGSEVDRQANEDIRQEVIALKEELAKLKEDNSFYRNLMAPTSNKRGLTFGVVEIGDTGAARSYRYKVVMQQLATNHRLLKGTLQFKVIGQSGGVDTEYMLSDLSDQVKNKDILLRFKYFQTIEGELNLPEGFEPEWIELAARTSGNKPVSIEKRFGWLVEEA